MDDIKQQPKTIERVREWEHKEYEVKDGYCYRGRKPAYTPPQKTPGTCHGCSSDEWKSNGIVRRIKETKEIILREKSR